MWLGAAGIAIASGQGCDAAKGCQAQLGLIGSGGGVADDRADRPLQLRTLADLLELVDAFASPEFGFDQAVARLGPIKKWIGSIGRVESVSPALVGPRIVMHKGELHGINSDLAEPIHTSWDDLVDELGAPYAEDWEVDNWNGPPIFEFVRSSPTGPVQVDLGVHRDGDAARIESFTLQKGPRTVTTMPRGR